MSSYKTVFSFSFNHYEINHENSVYIHIRQGRSRHFCRGGQNFRFLYVLLKNRCYVFLLFFGLSRGGGDPLFFAAKFVQALKGRVTGIPV